MTREEKNKIILDLYKKRLSFLKGKLDEDSYEDYSFPIVIKGDISGDGRISISDIIRVKKHLINIDVLTGIYEAAGDVTNTGSISVTDLVNMARDLAHIEELD